MKPVSRKRRRTVSSMTLPRCLHCHPALPPITPASIPTVGRAETRNACLTTEGQHASERVASYAGFRLQA
jgi:hypothetical protein